MANKRRVTPTRSKKSKPKPTKRSRSAPSSTRPASKLPAEALPQQAATAAPHRKPGYYEAIAIYESGVRALQRHDYPAAAHEFRTVLQRYPEERELIERARLYLRVCERETAQRPEGPQTPDERVYAATVALNAGDHETAMRHLRGALDQEPDSDHAHYILAVVLSTRGQAEDALEHLRRAIELNPENRALARQDPDLEPIRDLDAFRRVLETSAMPGRRRSRSRR